MDTLTALKLGKKVAEVAVEWTGTGNGSEGMEWLREKFFANARLMKHVPKLEMELWESMWDSVRFVLASQRKHERDQAWARAMDDPEGSALLACYIEDVHREPLRERHRMLERAVAGMMDMRLSLDDLARVRRAVAMLSPKDVLTLYALWLIPQVHGSAVVDNCYKYWEQTGAEALEGSNAVQLRSMAGFGIAGAPKLNISRTGMLILRALRTFVWEHPIPSDLPGHEARPGARSEAEAQAVLGAHPEALSIFASRANDDLTFEVGFDGITQKPDTAATGKATIRFYNMVEGDGARIRPLLSAARTAERHEPVDAIWVDRVEPGPPAYPGTEHVWVAGPHDVMRVLAYGLSALWTND